VQKDRPFLQPRLWSTRRPGKDLVQGRLETRNLLTSLPKRHLSSFSYLVMTSWTSSFVQVFKSSFKMFFSTMKLSGFSIGSESVRAERMSEEKREDSDLSGRGSMALMLCMDFWMMFRVKQAL